MYRYLLLLIAAVVAVFAAGCAAPAIGAPGGATAAPNTPAVDLPAAGGASPLATPGAAVSPVATPAGGSAVIPPALENAASAWLVGQANVSTAGLKLVKAEKAEWTDSCFGLGGPAESCLQAMTPGWRIVFDANGQQYEVRTDDAGSSFRLTPAAS